MQSMGLWDEFLVMFMADYVFDIFDYALYAKRAVPGKN